MVVYCCIVKFTSFQRGGRRCYEYLFACVERNKMDSKLLLKFIEHFPDYLSALSRRLFRFFWTTFVETAVYLSLFMEIRYSRVHGNGIWSFQGLLIPRNINVTLLRRMLREVVFSGHCVKRTLARVPRVFATVNKWTRLQNNFKAQKQKKKIVVEGYATETQEVFKECLPPHNKLAELAEIAPVLICVAWSAKDRLEHTKARKDQQNWRCP